MFLFPFVLCLPSSPIVLSPVHIHIHIHIQTDPNPIPLTIFFFCFSLCASPRFWALGCLVALSLLRSGRCRLVESLFAAPSLVVAIVFGLKLGSRRHSFPFWLLGSCFLGLGRSSRASRVKRKGECWRTSTDRKSVV